MECVIKLESFDLEKINIKNIEHLKLIKEFEFDNLVRKYNYPYSGSFYNLVVSNGYSPTIFNNFYAIRHKERLIGYIEIEDSKNIYLNYALLKKERKKGYATKVLKELSNYLLTNYRSKLDSVYTIIKKKNKESINTSIRSGFIFLEESNGFNTYVKKKS